MKTIKQRLDAIELKIEKIEAFTRKPKKKKDEPK
jgi:hypothetical protein